MRVLPPGDASLAGDHRSTYVGGADGQNLRLCRVQPSGAAQEPPKEEISASFRPLLEPARAARPKEATVSSPGGVRSQVNSLFQGRLEIRPDRLSDLKAPIDD